MLIDLVVYLIIVFVVLLGGVARSFKSFAVADRKYNSWLVALSLSATIFGSSSVVGLMGKSFKSGIGAGWWTMSGAFFLVVAGLFLADRVRKTEALTAPEILGMEFGKWVRVVAAVLLVVAWLGIVSAQFFAFSLLDDVVPDAGWVFPLLVISYTIFGGQKSVVLSDVVEFVLLITGLIVVAGYLVSSYGIGPLNMGTPLYSGSVSSTVLVFFVVGLPYIAGPDIYSRFLTAKSPSSAKKSALLSAVMVVLATLLIVFIGVFLRGIFGQVPLSSDEGVVRLFSILPKWIKMLFAVALSSALVSSADTCLATVSAVVSNDIVGGKEKVKMWTARLTVVVFGGLAFLLSKLDIGSDTRSKILTMLFASYSVYTGGIAAPMVLKLLGMKSREVFVILAMVVGGAVSLYGFVSGIGILNLSGMFISAVLFILGGISLNGFDRKAVS